MAKLSSYILVLALSAVLTCGASYGEEPGESEKAIAPAGEDDLPLYQKLIEELPVAQRRGVGEDPAEGDTLNAGNDWQRAPYQSDDFFSPENDFPLHRDLGKTPGGDSH